LPVARVGQAAAAPARVTPSRWPAFRSKTPVAPGPPGRAIVQTRRLGAGSSTTFTIKPPKAKGSYRYRVVKPASSGFLRGISATLTLVVT
jgi:hypothetical protein